MSTTARDGARLGYDILVAEDCVGDRDIPGASGAEVTKMVMAELGDIWIFGRYTCSLFAIVN